MKAFLVTLLIAGLALPAALVSAQSTADTQAALQAELAQNLAQQAVLQSSNTTLQGQAAGLQHDTSLLQAQIDQAKLKIAAANLKISQLTTGIGQKTDTITQLTQKTADSKASLAQLIRQTSMVEGYSLPDVILSSQSLSDFFNDLYVYSTLDTSLTTLVSDIQTAQAQTEAAKTDLSNQRDSVSNQKYIITQANDVVVAKQKQLNDLLAATKKTQTGYATVLAQRQARATAIRTALFQLAGGSKGIPFASALQYANQAYKATGVQPAFLLAILTQETNLGANVGTCNLPGDPASKQWQAIMPGPTSGSSRDDQTAYLKITSALGLDPASQPLSCPMGAGWGGAMGPSQFIPTTWLAYAPRVTAALGESGMANPWSPLDAFTASSVYLADLGASAGTYTAERTAALKYYAGGNWQKAANAFYGNQVMAKVQSIQDNIDALNGV